MLVNGIMSAILGALTLHAPGITAVVLVLYVAAWAIVAGISQIALGWRIRKEVSGEWLLYVAGTAALLLGLSILWDRALERSASRGCSPSFRCCLASP